LRLRVMLAVLILAFGACTSGNDDNPPSGASPSGSPGPGNLVFADPDLPVTEPAGIAVDDYVRGLKFAVDMTWDGEDTFFVTEKKGAIRVVTGGELLAEPCTVLPVNFKFLAGALGIVLDPDYDQNHYLYVYYTNKEPYENRVTRFTVADNKCTSPEHIITGIPASKPHNGGQMVFMDDKLFVTTGDAMARDRAQLTDSLEGKVLRLEADGSIPDDNPFSTPDEPNPVWSYGHRNPFGLAVRPGTNQLFETENGQECNDEMNIIVKGANYGWPSTCEGGMAGEDPHSPLLTWAGIIVPTDLWWYDGKIKAISDSLLMAEFRLGRVHRFTMNDAGTKVLDHTIIYQDENRVIHVSDGPDGWLYMLTVSGIRRMTTG
jgi:aldose sugar dehydrogenase